MKLPGPSKAFITASTGQALTSAFPLGILFPPCRYQHHQRQGIATKLKSWITFSQINREPLSIQNARMILTQGWWRYMMKWWFA